MSVFLPITDPYYEWQHDPPEEEPDIADWADWEPDEPCENPMLATASSVGDLQSEPPIPERKPVEVQLDLFRQEVA